MVKQLQDDLDDLDLSESQKLAMFDGLLCRVGAQRSPWGICQNCSEFFVIVDRDMARSCAVLGIEPAGSGPVDTAEFNQIAAKAWEHVFGRWPATVRQPITNDSCDLCAKKIYVGEMISRMNSDILNQHRALGIIDRTPLSPPRDGDVWLLCAICLTRTLARRYQHDINRLN